MAATFGLRHMASLTPVKFFFVVITLITPFGIPASSANAAAARADKGVSSEGLTTAVQPQASAAPSFLVIIALGKFQGQMMAATPTGSRMKIICFVFVGLGTVSPFILLASSENHSRNA